MLGLRTMFNYYGGKWRLAPKYPPPRYKRIIEPFAGGAGYSLRYYERNAHLYEIDERIYSLWKYLINVKASEIRSLPIGVIWHVDDLKGVCEEAKLLIAVWIATSGKGNVKEATTWYLQGDCPTKYWGEKIRERIATQVDLIRHWKIYNACYSTAPNNIATWFVDPPYNNAAGSQYKYSNVDYEQLAKWCKKRNGQLIACENGGADWLPFEPFQIGLAQPGRAGGTVRSKFEAVYLQDHPIRRKRRHRAG